MNVARPVGASARLELYIASKSFPAAGASRAVGKPHEVLREVSLSLAPGETGAIVGPSGCGKSTLLRIVAGLDQDWRGAVTVPARASGAQARIGVVFQEPRLLPWRTLEQNVRLGAPLATDSELDSLFTATGLQAHRQHHPAQLSGGLARRAALVRAFAFNPDLLLLDEPFVSLDAVLAGALRRLLADLVLRETVTTLLVTHDLDEAIGLSDRIFFLAGRPASIAFAETLPSRRGQRSPGEIASIRRDLLARGVVPGAEATPPED